MGVYACRELKVNGESEKCFLRICICFCIYIFVMVLKYVHIV